MPVHTVRIATRDGLRLEGRLGLPESPRGGAVICHPHPLYQGSMSSSLVPAIQRALERTGWAALRFNFRGVGRSEGTYGRGLGEIHDAAAALEVVAEAVDTRPLTVVGWSFGALVGLAAAVADPRVSAFVAVAPPVSMRHDVDLPALPAVERLSGWRGRALAVCGTDDPFCRPRAMEEWAAAIPGMETEVMDGCDHFFTGARDRLAERVASFVAGSA